MRKLEKQPYMCMQDNNRLGFIPDNWLEEDFIPCNIMRLTKMIRNTVGLLRVCDSTLTRCLRLGNLYRTEVYFLQ